MTPQKAEEAGGAISKMKAHRREGTVWCPEHGEMR